MNSFKEFYTILEDKFRDSKIIFKFNINRCWWHWWLFLTWLTKILIFPTKPTALMEGIPWLCCYDIKWSDITAREHRRMRRPISKKTSCWENIGCPLLQENVKRHFEIFWNNNLLITEGRDTICFPSKRSSLRLIFSSFCLPLLLFHFI